MLKAMRIECLTAATGEEGIRLYRENRDKIGFVILDIEMPGLSGDRVFKMLRDINHDVRILVASGYSQEYLENKIFKMKIHHYMAKPFQLKQLTKKLNELMGG
jgi:YesN/AraC family two-component response regulator